MLHRINLTLSLCFAALLLSAQSTSLQLKAFLEGPYNDVSRTMDTKLHELGYLPGMEPTTFFGKSVPSDDPYGLPTLKSSNTLDISLYSARSVDWILVSIMEESGREVWRRTLLLEKDGKVVTEQISSLSLDQDKRYSVGISHRNHLPVQSPLLSIEDDILSFDYTISDIVGLKNIGGASVLRGGALRIPSEDIHMIEMADVERWTNFVGQNSSYLLADIDMDGDVSIHDKSIILGNLDASVTLK